MTPPLRRSVLRAGLVCTLTVGTVLAAAAPAFAHVTAQPGEAEQGSYSVVTMRVPNESDTAGTVGLAVTLPAEHPLSSVRTSPVPGWTASVTRAPLDPPVETESGLVTEAVRTVTWTAAPGTRIGPGEFLEFPLSLGPLPTDATEFLMAATQAYDDGEVVAWDQRPAADGSEPANPAPSVTLVPAAATDGGSQPAAASPPAGDDTTARWLGGAGLLVGALGLGLGGGAVLRTRRRDPAGPADARREATVGAGR